jgi:hypothetical protein
MTKMPVSKVVKELMQFGFRRIEGASEVGIPCLTSTFVETSSIPDDDGLGYALRD